MKRVLIKSLKGDIIDRKDIEDPMPFIMQGIKEGKWGKQETIKGFKECSRSDLANVVEILEGQKVKIGADYKIEIQDVETAIVEKEKNKAKRMELIRDFDALLPHRKDKLKEKIYKWILSNADIDVNDI